MNTYASPYQIGLGDSVNYNFKNYLVLINYIKGETDAKGYTPKSNRTILIDDNDNRIVCDDFDPQTFDNLFDAILDAKETYLP